MITRLSFRSMQQLLLRFTVVAAISLVPLASLVVAEERVQFNRDIRPILSRNCLYCHGPDEKKREAGLRLDTQEGAIEDLGGYQAIEPGNPKASEVIVRILSDDPDMVMPPPDAEKTISEKERALLVRWIDEGAVYQEHWSWQPLKSPMVPGDAEGTAAIDAFLADGWEQMGVASVEPASPREQIRRLSFDLRGLPPTMEEVAEFQSDPSDATFDQFRDRWMSELTYAEHQSVRWLDLVRWADTSGFVSDEPIASGAYRAWVIKAHAANMPFDEFSKMQLAGDLIESPTDDSLIASGYNRIVNTNCEAGAIEEEQLYKLKGEHVRAIGTVWMGLTTGCAECHDHKFDPITAKDYYSLAAFFDDLIEAGVYTPGDRRVPLHYVHSESSSTQLDYELCEQIDEIKQQLFRDDGEFDAAFSDWESTIREKLKDSQSRKDFVWIPGMLPGPRIVEGDFDLRQRDDKVVRSTHADAQTFHRHHASDLMSGYVNHGSQKTDAENDAWFVNVWIDADNRPEMLGVQISQGDYGRLGWKTANYETYYWGDDSSGTLAAAQPWSDPERVKRIGDLPAESGWVRLRIPSSDWIKPVSGQAFECTGMAWLQTSGSVEWADSGLELRTDKATALELGETAIRKWYERPYNRQVFQTRAEFVAKSLLVDASKRDNLQREVAYEAYREQTQPQLMSQLREAESELYILRCSALPVLVSRASDQRKSTRLLGRGDYLDETGPVVQPAVPGFLGDLGESAEPLTRLDLANWLFGQGEALTARVFVNRLWHQFYGRGLSDTLEDSGTQGNWPSHLDLLNWLAVEFRDCGWDRDHMVRLLTSTKAYRLSSVPSAKLAQQDADNRWHGRQGRFRLPAESIRDSALTVAGLLKRTEEIPLASFFPYQPKAYWERSSKVMYGSRHMPWSTSSESMQYHRSLYTFWKRQNIHPTMLAFDAPTRQECTAQRNVTNTPGQALALLNDPIFVESARVLAMRIVQSAEATDQERIGLAFTYALQRIPSDRELKVLLGLLASQRQHYRDSVEAAELIVEIGQAKTPADIDASELAAWTAVTRAILNLHEFLYRS
ncbi:MAG: PSD1 and planctomycete cytochrome C domain-containing protein [Pirellulaceae bacterium]